jgi:integrase
MDFKTELINKLKDKNLSESSIKLYLRNLEKLNGGDLKDFKFLSKPEKVEEVLKEYKDNTKRSILISIVSVLGCCPDDKKIVKLRKTYYDMMIKKSNEIKENTTDEPTEEQKANWISQQDVLLRFEALKEEAEKLRDLKTLTENQYNSILHFMILALYVKASPRRNKDYQYMNVVYKDSDKLSKDVNYLAFTDNEFIFNVYKTSKKYGQKKEKYNDELKQCIELYLKFHPKIKGSIKKNTNTPFLVNFKGEPFMQVNSMTKIFNRIFGKKISSSALRHIFLSDKYGDVVKEMKKDSDAMGHSSAQQKEYIKNVV